MKTYLSASILAADFANLKNEIDAVMAAGCDYVHFDVMDNHFVPNLTFGAPICAALRKAEIKAPIDVHLMVTEPEKFIVPFAKAGANILIFHDEVVDNQALMVKKIKAAGMEPGIAFNPSTPVNIEPEIFSDLKLILIMTVNPGFGGQSFMPECLEKIKHARQLIKKNGAKTFLAVDGGIKVDNIKIVKEAGADFFVVGSGLFNAEDYQQRINQLREQIDD